MTPGFTVKLLHLENEQRKTPTLLRQCSYLTAVGLAGPNAPTIARCSFVLLQPIREQLRHDSGKHHLNFENRARLESFEVILELRILKLFKYY